MTQQNLTNVDWSKLPVPQDDGDAMHLLGLTLPNTDLPATDGEIVNLSRLSGRVVLYIYPLTGQPGVALPDGWDELPGARGCTPQSCSFRDHHKDLQAAGANNVFGLSTQDTDYQREAAERLHLPFALLSDAKLEFASAIKLPGMIVDGRTLLKRMALIIDNGCVTHVFYPVFPPDQNAPDVLAWLRQNPVEMA